jgi:hypothetical protein
LDGNPRLKFEILEFFSPSARNFQSIKQLNALNWKFGRASCAAGHDNIAQKNFALGSFKRVQIEHIVVLEKAYFSASEFFTLLGDIQYGGFVGILFANFNKERYWSQ